MNEDLLTKEEQRSLLKMAREAVTCCVIGKDTPDPTIDEGRLAQKRGCFVCIKIRGTLRGCIGNFTSDKPLYHLVQEMSASAACRDPRFYPMKTHDLEDFSLEISVLTPLKKIESIEEIEVGKHGIYIEKNFFRGVLLPQVATEQGWDRDTFLSQICLKAGLQRDDWKEGADISIFGAQVFNEKIA